MIFVLKGLGLFFLLIILSSYFVWFLAAYLKYRFECKESHHSHASFWDFKKEFYARDWTFRDWDKTDWDGDIRFTFDDAVLSRHIIEFDDHRMVFGPINYIRYRFFFRYLQRLKDRQESLNKQKLNAAGGTMTGNVGLSPAGQYNYRVQMVVGGGGGGSGGSAGGAGAVGTITSVQQMFGSGLSAGNGGSGQVLPAGPSGVAPKWADPYEALTKALESSIFGGANATPTELAGMDSYLKEYAKTMEELAKSIYGDSIAPPATITPEELDKKEKESTGYPKTHAEVIEELNKALDSLSKYSFNAEVSDAIIPTEVKPEVKPHDMAEAMVDALQNRKPKE